MYSVWDKLNTFRMMQMLQHKTLIQTLAMMLQ